ncbi:hypothetical protein NC652_028848 [Populus alba x Populus x berolinensis]|nr:hypothetical protein NC652_028784 [Populus alba x Populus x berolinensis]KAJ6887674.1 hypothetical protein NC652_028823 [Populus alba x Populus x berolinensis]KAJ6887699.1 hypothetical protein NC652_028848 [Populus alba x Populus x berolinensis]
MDRIVVYLVQYNYLNPCRSKFDCKINVENFASSGSLSPLLLLDSSLARNFPWTLLLNGLVMIQSLVGSIYGHDECSF